LLRKHRTAEARINLLLRHCTLLRLAACRHQRAGELCCTRVTANVRGACVLRPERLGRGTRLRRHGLLRIWNLASAHRRRRSCVRAWLLAVVAYTHVSFPYRSGTPGFVGLGI
jgi:hypothetical protein